MDLYELIQTIQLRFGIPLEQIQRMTIAQLWLMAAYLRESEAK